ncbi:hypothetical protein ACPCSP_25655 [Streptomyces cinereoruber]|uniref:hypothetical protein n=1 Tax=Streptomyces cinereoruber TaxID=67260 RepID=UPI003C2EF14A
MTTPKKRSRAPYEPSQPFKDAFAALEQAEQAEADARQEARRVVADELRSSQQSNARVAEHTPWTEETVRTIANEFGIPPKSPGGSPPPYDPSPAVLKTLADAFEALRQAEARTKEAWTAARATVAEELRTSQVSRAKIVPHTPWTEGTITNIAKEYDVPGLRAPTVRSIKD